MLPKEAITFAEPMDPADVERWTVTLTQGIAEDDLLSPGEDIDLDTLTVLPSTEAAEYGLEVLEDGVHFTSTAGLAITFWTQCLDPSLEDFDGPGLRLGIEITFLTTATPPRKKQRTWGILVRNK